MKVKYNMYHSRRKKYSEYYSEVKSSKKYVGINDKLWNMPTIIQNHAPFMEYVIISVVGKWWKKCYEIHVYFIRKVLINKCSEIVGAT